MIVDTSAFIAIARAEPEATTFLAALHGARVRLMSAASWVEVSAVLSRDGLDHLFTQAEQLLEVLRIQLEPMTVQQGREGHAAYRKFGKGRHKAKLNLGDCLSYALAKETGLPLLFKGDDFTQTDIQRAI